MKQSKLTYYLIFGIILIMIFVAIYQLFFYQDAGVKPELHNGYPF